MLTFTRVPQGNLLAAEQQIRQTLKASQDDIDALTAFRMIEGKMGRHQERVQAFGNQYTKRKGPERDVQDRWVKQEPKAATLRFGTIDLPEVQGTLRRIVC